MVVENVPWQGIAENTRRPVYITGAGVTGNPLSVIKHLQGQVH